MNPTQHATRITHHVLITGGAGFIGSHLTERLLAEGARVTVIDDLSTGSLDNLKAALKDVKPAEVFVPSLSPTSMQDWNRNQYYKSDKEFLYALADVMHEEYKAIVDAGFLVQVVLRPSPAIGVLANGDRILHGGGKPGG